MSATGLLSSYLIWYFRSSSIKVRRGQECPGSQVLLILLEVPVNAITRKIVGKGKKERESHKIDHIGSKTS